MAENAVLEDGHHDPERRRCREEVEGDRLKGDHKRMEDHQQQKEREAQDETEDEGDGVEVDLCHVQGLRRASGDVGLDSGEAAKRLRDHGRAHLAYDRLARRVILSSSHRE